MQRLFFILICLLFLQSAWAQKHKKKFIDLLEPDSKLISSGYNFTIEKTDDGLYILKRYYPENRMITHYVSSKSKSFEIKHGLFQHRCDDGTIVSKGMYLNDKKEGEWIEYTNQQGYYKNDKKEGKWKVYNNDTIVIEETNYKDSLLHGKLIKFDTLGNIKLEEEYQMGELISTTNDSVSKIVEDSPRFSGCEDQNLSKDDLITCAQTKLLHYLYSKLRYPPRSRRFGIQGKALARFVIEKDGSVGDIKILNGVSQDIKTEIISIISEMPRWIPGMQNGEPVRVQFTLPFMFKLE